MRANKQNSPLLKVDEGMWPAAQHTPHTPHPPTHTHTHTHTHTLSHARTNWTKLSPWWSKRKNRKKHQHEFLSFWSSESFLLHQVLSLFSFSSMPCLCFRFLLASSIERTDDFFGNKRLILFNFCFIFFIIIMVCLRILTAFSWISMFWCCQNTCSCSILSNPSASSMKSVLFLLIVPPRATVTMRASLAVSKLHRGTEAGLVPPNNGSVWMSRRRRHSQWPVRPPSLSQARRNWRSLTKRGMMLVSMTGWICNLLPAVMFDITRQASRLISFLGYTSRHIRTLGGPARRAAL